MCVAGFDCGGFESSALAALRTQNRSLKRLLAGLAHICLREFQQSLRPCLPPRTTVSFESTAACQFAELLS